MTRALKITANKKMTVFPALKQLTANEETGAHKDSPSHPVGRAGREANTRLQGA